LICGNCGFQNQSTDEFCGSCGQFLAWNATPADETAEGTATVIDGPAGGGTTGAGGAVGTTTGSTGAGGVAGPTTGSTGGATPTGWEAGVQRCPRCGTANELTRTFCLKCGNRLAGTASGTTTRLGRTTPGDQRPARTLAIVLGGALVLLAAAALAFVALGGLGRPGSTLPPGTFMAGASPTLGPISSAPAASEQPSPTAAPPSGAPASASATDAATQLPSTEPPSTTPPATPPPAGEFSCADQVLTAAAPGEWTIVSARWSRRGGADSLAFALEPAGGSAAAAAVTASLVPLGEVTPRFNLPPPGSGDIALVLSFNESVNLTGPFGAEIGYRALRDFDLVRRAGLVYGVIGVSGAGCYGLSSPGWASGSGSDSELVVRIAR
jgi:hypothetical protein